MRPVHLRERWSCWNLFEIVVAGMASEPIWSPHRMSRVKLNCLNSLTTTNLKLGNGTNWKAWSEVHALFGKLASHKTIMNDINFWKTPFLLFSCGFHSRWDQPVGSMLVDLLCLIHNQSHFKHYNIFEAGLAANVFRMNAEIWTDIICSRYIIFKTLWYYVKDLLWM